MKANKIIIIILILSLKIPAALAQRIVNFESSLLQRGDTCALYGFINSQSVPLDIQEVKVPGTITLKDTLLSKISGGIYVLMLPAVIKSNIVTILYSGIQENDFHLYYNATGDGNIIFKNNEANNNYYAYLHAVQKMYTDLRQWEADYHNAKDSLQKEKIRNQSLATLQSLYEYGKRIAQVCKGTLAAKLIECNNTPPLPGIAWNSEYASCTSADEKYTIAIKSVIEHYWEGVDFADTTLLHTPYLSGKARQFTQMFHPTDSGNIRKSIKTLLQQISVNEQVYHVVQSALLEVYAKPNTPAYNEAVAIDILKDEYKCPFTPTWRKEIITSNLSLLEKNKNGSKAADLELQDVQGNKHTLYATKAKYTLLYFFDPECSRCSATTPHVQEWLNTQQHKNIEVCAVYMGSDEKQLRQYVQDHSFPANWHCWWGEKKYLDIHSKYWIESLPAIYLLDENKNVILKNASYIQLTGYFQ